MNKEQDLRAEKVALLVGTIIGQLSQILNNIAKEGMREQTLYYSLKDIHDMAALQIHELYYKGNTP